VTTWARGVSDRADADLDELVDLDGHEQDDQRQDDGPAPGWLARWARSRWALPAAVTAVVLLLGVAGLQQVRVSAASEVADLRRTASVQLGTATLFFSGAPGDGGPGADGHVEQRVQVGVRNTGDEDLTITPVATTVAHARVVPGAEGLSLRAGTGGGMTFLLDVDCDAVPPPANGYSGGEVPPVATDVLRLSVATGGGGSGEDGSAAEHDYLLPDGQWGGLAQELAHTCSPDAGGPPVSATAQEDAEGNLVLDLYNRTDDPVEVRLQSPLVLGASADPALPLDVPAGTTTVVLSLAPDCPGVSELDSGGRDPYALDTNVAVQAEDGSWNTLVDTTSAVAWVARQVALGCG